MVTSTEPTSEVVTTQPSGNATNVTTTNSTNSSAGTEPKRKVSIATDPVSETRMGHDNYSYEPSTRRKVSQVKIDFGFIYAHHYTLYHLFLISNLIILNHIIRRHGNEVF